MNVPKYFLAPALVLLISLGAVGQTARRRGATRTPPPSKVAAPQPTPEPVATPLPPKQPKAPIPLAIVNNQTISTVDIDPAVRQEVESLDDRIAETRRRVLELQINTELLEIEARKRKMTSQQLYDLEVARKVPNPTEAEIKKFIDDNRDQIGETDEKALRTQVISVIRANGETKMTEDFVRRLRTTSPVVMGVDVNSAKLNPTDVLATVGGKSISAGLVMERLKPAIYKMQLDVYEKESEALEQTINDILLIAEANRRNVPPEEIVRTEVTDKSRPPTEAEISKFYTDNKARIGRELNEVRPQLTEYLQEQSRHQLQR
ncbi:MAG TPA: hypothetical protein VFH01_00115, partial [Pyrinomonadaceae bacterium]|nr:hypothetical protein [Pyrinomonadaceae bacterium]